MLIPLAAFLAGTGLSALNLIGWRLGLRLVTSAVTEETPAKLGSILILLLFFVKLPLLVLTGIWFMKQPEPLPACFLTGFGLVYFALIAWGWTSAKALPSRPNGPVP
ncbi:hypothetical protein EON80_01340 [bacterium]|nr:MAG: hypothetical protein EON80_01340 [bacterium]